ncbi:MAG: isoprenylcysteine carboxylmethyltransferase family protein [Candidatus Aenigmarchaeota archaeon]|nr:isoprenylcysteine carboxylmethyltransferase family protein [Candidatus Aenigmarchaeota archaeon]
MIKRYIEWQRKKYSQLQKLLFLVIVVPFFFFIFIPGLSFVISKEIESIVILPRILPYPFNILTGTFIFASGLTLFLWTVIIFFRIGKGTPSPFIPTQKLVTSGPFAHSRNPMVLGVIIYVAGLGVIFNSLSFIGIGLVIPLSYLAYIKLVEEKELEARFGKEYIQYKKRVPFLIPNL